MDNKKKDYFQVMSKFCQIHILRKPVLLSVSIIVFALLFSRLPMFNGLLQYVEHFFSDAYSIKLFTYDPERNFMFLLFNGILALIIKDSGFLRNPPKNDSVEAKEVENNDQEADISAAELSEKEEEITKEEVLGEECGIQKGVSANVEGGENMHLTTEQSNRGSQEANEISEAAAAAAEEEEEEAAAAAAVDEEFEKVNSEEFYWKCEDFIKKTKEGIKTEFKEVLVVWNLET